MVLSINKKINRSVATELLISLIEGSDDHIIRSDSIKAFEAVGIKEKASFKILENALLSDESQIVRSAALNAIGNVQDLHHRQTFREYTVISGLYPQPDQPPSRSTTYRCYQ